MSKITPLYELHQQLGGQIVDFAGYLLPIQYQNGILFEHNTVRNKVGLFDVSHMGELMISGEDAECALNAVLTNDIRGMYDGQVRYSLLPNDKGGAVDDVLIYRYNQKRFLVVVNASNADKDAAWIESRLEGDVVFENLSDDTAQIAIQGPFSINVLSKLVNIETLPQKYYSFVSEIMVKGVKCLISKTGYTGEDGYELYCTPVEAEKLYLTLLNAGKEFGIAPAGLGARDTLRLEAGMPLYGHELGEDIFLNEVGLNFAIKMAKDDFVGKSALSAHEPAYTRIGAKVVDRGIAREHSLIFCGDEEVGYVTSGTFSPTLQTAICMLRVKLEFADKPLTVDVRGKRLKLEVVALPFYKKKA